MSENHTSQEPLADIRGRADRLKTMASTASELASNPEGDSASQLDSIQRLLNEIHEETQSLCQCIHDAADSSSRQVFAPVSRFVPLAQLTTTVASIVPDEDTAIRIERKTASIEEIAVAVRRAMEQLEEWVGQKKPILGTADFPRPLVSPVTPEDLVELNLFLTRLSQGHLDVVPMRNTLTAQSQE